MCDVYSLRTREHHTVSKNLLSKSFIKCDKHINNPSHTMCASFTVGIAFYMCWFTYRKTYIVCCIYGAICAVLTLRIACSVLGESTVLCIYNSWENLVLGLAVSCCIRATSTTKKFFIYIKVIFCCCTWQKSSWYTCSRQYCNLG